MAEDDGQKAPEHRSTTPPTDDSYLSQSPEHTNGGNPSSTRNDENQVPASNEPSSADDSLPPHKIDSSLLETTTLDDGDKYVDSFTEEQRLHDHLKDVESSFIPPISPIQVATKPEEAVDDTFLFDVSPTKRAQQKQPAILQSVLEPDSSMDISTDQIPATDPNLALRDRDARTPEVGAKDEGDGHSGLSPLPAYESELELPLNAKASRVPSGEVEGMADASGEGESQSFGNTSSLENFQSSPTAAAAARTISKSVSMATIVPSKDQTAEEDSEYDTSVIITPQEGPTSAPRPKRYSSELDVRRLASDAGATPGQALKTGKRPRFLQSRNASQRSSASSFLTNEDVDIDASAGLGADIIPPPGATIPHPGMNRNMSQTLSRTISLGSMASGIDDYSEDNRIELLEPPLEEDEHNMLSTPKANKLVAPTDTVIARKVRNVQVPESLAKEYKTKGGLTTPFKATRNISDATPSAASTITRGGKNLTLKEQSSTIERLSKENFDLKLKVMFLSDRLDKLSPEGVKETLTENVDLKTSLGIIQRDNKVLRRKIKDLERQLKEAEGRPSTARSGFSSEDGTPGFNDENARDREEELIYLRERVEEYITEIEHLRSESFKDQQEKHKLAETAKTYRDYLDRSQGHPDQDEEVAVWKDLLERETVQREQVDEENRKLREELYQMKQGNHNSSVQPQPGASAMHHTTNIYNITRKRGNGSPTRSRPGTGHSNEVDRANSLSQADTLFEDYRRENEQLRHEVGELRREVGAQTSMLTSRNREKERLYQEIEDLKLSQRRGGGAAPSTIDSLLDRSASRAGQHQRSVSRTSGGTQLAPTEEDPDREELENRVAEYRDKISELKLLNQELQRESLTTVEELEQFRVDVNQLRQECDTLQEERDAVEQDLLTMQGERDEALQELSILDQDFNALQKEAQETIFELEEQMDQQQATVEQQQADLDQYQADTDQLQQEIQERADNFAALQEEMRALSEALAGLEDEQENKMRHIQRLEAELSEANKELEELEAKLLEANNKSERLGVQLENSQGETAFLREEQEADKIRIGDLEAMLATAEQTVRDEHDRAKELDQRLSTERQQREILANREKEEVQQYVNELNKEASSAKDEVRKLRKSLSSREVEATEWKERLMELENNLREALGDLNGTRSSLLKSIAKLQRELENTVRELDVTRNAGLEKDRLLKQRDAQLESHGLEVRKLGETLEKERQAHRNTKNHYETFQRTHSHVSRTVTSQDSRISELEGSRSADKRKIFQLEQQFKDQLAERNNLLLTLWTRLSTICGTDWAHNNSLISGRALPSTEAISTMLPGFSKNILAAIKMIESIISNFNTRAKSIERELWKEYQSLESTLDAKSKKLERLEVTVRSGVASGQFDAQAKFTQLESAYRALKIENATLQRAHDARIRGAPYMQKPGSNSSREGDIGSPSPAIPTGPQRRSESMAPRSRIPQFDPNTPGSKRSSSRPGIGGTTGITRSVSTMNATEIERLGTSTGIKVETLGSMGNNNNSNNAGDMDVRWMFRLRELEAKLKQEREARNMDRAAARQRIQDSERQNGELAAELSRARRKANEQ